MFHFIYLFCSAFNLFFNCFQTEYLGSVLNFPARIIEFLFLMNFICEYMSNYNLTLFELSNKILKEYRKYIRYS